MDKLANSQNKLNTTLSVARVFAILSVVAAHITMPGSDIVSKLINAFGSIGVTVYFIMSGYFYRTNKFKSILEMFHNKFKNIIVPWVVMGVAVYFYVNIVSRASFSFQGLIFWIVGYKTYLYYISMLMLCYSIFYKRNRATLYISIVLNILSVYLTAFGVINFEKIHLTNYLNIFNWIGYFSLGLLLQEIDASKILSILGKIKYPSIILSILLYAIICILNIPTGYFSFIGMPFQLLWVLSIVSVSSFTYFDKKIIHTISNMTFSVYFIHMPLIGILSKAYNKFIFTRLLSPIIVVLVCLIVLYVGYIIARKIKLGNLYCLLTGLRMNRNIKEK